MDQAKKRRSGSLFLDAQHQLRQPLNAISLLIGELRDAEDGRDRAAIVEDMRYALQLSNAWLDSLTDLEKAEQGMLQLQVQDVALHQIFAKLREDFTVVFADLGLGFRVVDTTASVRADPAVLRRQLTLLLENAAKFTRQGKVLLGCRRAGDKLRIEVWDSGLGVADVERERLFEAFYRLENEVRPRERGLGLGLTYASRLAEIGGDALTVSSRLGEGSCFALTLERGAGSSPRDARVPAAAAATGNGMAEDDSPFGALPAEAQGSPMPPDPLAGARVLLVVGEEAESLRGSFSAWGAEVTATTVDNLGAALGAGPDLLLADLAVLEAGGQGKLPCQAEDPPAVIMLVDKRPVSDADDLPLRAHFLEKPIRPARLRSLCHYALTHR